MVIPDPGTNAADLEPVCKSAVLKIASRCNLNCTYCYVYNMGDDGWRGRPKLMTRDVATAAISALAAHARRHGLHRFEFIFHGGEPLLAPRDFLSWFVDEARQAMGRETSVGFALQTNGVLLDRPWAMHLYSLGIRVGVSIDATPASHDRSRLDHKGRGSYARAARGLREAQDAGLDPGVLAVVDLATDPDEVFQHLADLRPRMVDFLLPQATWDRPPARFGPRSYGEWLLTIFRRWAEEPRPPFRIRLFEVVIGAVLGRPRNYDALGEGQNAVITVEADGALESVDVLRVCENGLTRRGYSVFRNTIDDALSDTLARAYYFSSDRPCDQCRECRIRDLCAGGYLPHRYSRRTGFNNPSVYCPDLMELIVEIQRWTVGQLTPELRAETGLRALERAAPRHPASLMT